MPDAAKLTLVTWLGCRDYGNALELQMEICRLKKIGFEKDVLLLLEHPPTITLGRNAQQNHLLVSQALHQKMMDDAKDVELRKAAELTRLAQEEEERLKNPKPTKKKRVKASKKAA